MNIECPTCQHFDRCNQEDRWYGCINYKSKPITNADRIRSMPDEELAELLRDTQCNTCDWQGNDCDDTDECKAERLEWLKQEVTKDGI